MVPMENVVLGVTTGSAIVDKEHNCFTFIVPNDVLQFVRVLFVGNKNAGVDGDDLIKSCFA